MAMTDTSDDWFGPEFATFGDRVTAAREATGMTQAELAKRLGVKKSTVRGWEEDLSEPRANKLSMMAGLLNVSMMWLINGEGEGLDAPQDAEALNVDIAGVLNEMRALRTEMQSNAAAMGRLEKRMRQLMDA